MNLINKEIQIIKNQTSQLLSQKEDIINELDKQNIARCMIATEHLICTVSVVKKPKDEEQQILLFEELDKLQGMIKKWS